jgi:hypothetical protein
LGNAAVHLRDASLDGVWDKMGADETVVVKPHTKKLPLTTVGLSCVDSSNFILI